MVNIIHIVYILLPLYLLCNNVEGSTYIAESGLECNKCPPGTHWKADCTADDRRSICLNCPDGSYSETENIAEYCEKCLPASDCTRGTVFVNACSPITNNRCECPDGQYWETIDSYDGACFNHTLCNDDEVIVKKGTVNENTQCGPKPVDPTSNGTDVEHQPGTGNNVTTTQLPPDNGEDGKHNPVPEDDDDAKEGLNWKLIVARALGTIVSCFAIAAVIIAGVLCCIKIQRHERQSDNKQHKNRRRNKTKRKHF